MSEIESLEYISDSDCEKRSLSPNDATHTMFYLARPAPAKTSQKLHLRPRLIMQVQMVRYMAHAMPIIELWRPGVLSSGRVKYLIPRAKLRMSDIYVCRYAGYPTPELAAAGQEEDLIAVIRKRKLSHMGNSITIYFPKGKLVTVYRSTESHYQCAWEDANRGLLKMEWRNHNRSESEEYSFTISDSNGVQVTVGCINDRTISIARQKERPSSGDGFHSGSNFDILLVFAALLKMDRAYI